MDLPTPGSPPSRVTEPATSPPPRTRSSSPIPVGTGTAEAELIDRSGNGVELDRSRTTAAATGPGSARVGRKSGAPPPRRRCSTLRRPGSVRTSEVSYARIRGSGRSSWVASCREPTSRVSHSGDELARRPLTGGDAQESAPAPASSTAGGSKPSMARKTSAPSSSSTMTVSPTRNSFQRIFSESGSSMSC